MLIPAWVSFGPAFCIMYSSYKLNRQSDNKQLCHTPSPILNQSIVPCLVLTIASWPAYRFLRWQVMWYGIPITLRIFQFVVIHTVKCFSRVKEAKVSLEFPCFFYDPADIANLISGSFAFSKPRLYMWKFSVHFPDSSVGKESALNAGDPSLIPGSGRSPGEGIDYPFQYSWVSLVDQLVKNLPSVWETWVGKILWRRERLPPPVLWPGEFHGLYSPWGHKESDITERLSLPLSERKVIKNKEKIKHRLR